MLFDTHCHLQAPEFEADRSAVLARARQAGVAALAIVGTNVEDSAAALSLARWHPGLVATVGCHPHYAAGLGQTELAAIRALARDPAVVAIGEIGLDFYRNLSPPAAQVAAFRALLDLAAEEALPVVIHSRSADLETFDLLRPWAEEVGRGWPRERPLGVMHCYAGDRALAGRYIELGFLISIAGPVTYPKAKRLAELARELPLAALVVETDAPYLAPQPQRGRRNEPAYLTETVARIAQLRGEPAPAVAEATVANAQRLFGPVEAVARAALEGRA